MGGCNSKEEEFFKAVQAGEQDEVRHLAAKIETINFHEPKTGNTPLHVACLCGNTEMASFLLQLNADVNSRDAKGRSPLYVASLGGYVEVVTALLVAGAEVNARTNDGLSSAYAAAWRGRYKVLVLLVETHAADLADLDSMIGVAQEWQHTNVYEYLRGRRQQAAAISGAGGGDANSNQHVSIQIGPE